MSKGIYISTENRKIKNCLIFNLPTGVTCKPRTQCSKICYAKKAERLYPGVRNRRILNYKLAKGEDFVKNVDAAVRKARLKTCRIHESGDFFSREYVQKWYNICRHNHNVIFYAYTKRNDIFDSRLLRQKPDNLRLIWSVDGVQKAQNLRLMNEIVDKLEQGFDKASVITEHLLSKRTCPVISSGGHCQTDCRWCSDGNKKVIFFPKH